VTAPIAFVAPLPPPVHGFSNICAAMLNLLRARAAVNVFDRSPHAAGGLAARIRRSANPARFLIWCIRNKDARLYLGLSGGWGQIIDGPYVLIARMLGRRIFVHHHSFAYINAPSALNRWLFAFLREQTHVVLSRRMGAELARIYRLNPSKLKVVSNAAFYAAIPANSPPRAAGEAPIRLGYLSAVSVEKGIVEFFGVLDELRRLGIAHVAKIAGPVDPAAQHRFDELLAGASNVEYTGPIYGSEKERFYRDVDVFLFPSDYANEAEPLVVIEAMRSGAYVIACERGAIAEMLANGGGAVCSRSAYVANAAACIRRLSADRADLERAQGLALMQARRLSEASSAELSALLEEISESGHGEPPVPSLQHICGQNQK